MATASEQWIHMVGIAGAGMSGIARVLLQRGYKISGSDLQCNSITQNLRELGIEIYTGHSSSNIKEGVDLLVISSAIPENNPEVKLARDRNIPVMKRGRMLANLVNDMQGIAVAGAHGKTTTTSMLYMVLNNCDIDPTFIIGGELQNSDINARLGKSEYAVVEADESDASFLEINPYIAIVTNIEDDHLDYYKTFDNLRNAFITYINGVKPGGFALVYGEDDCIKSIIKEVHTRVITYGEDTGNDYYMTNWKPVGMGSSWDAFHNGKHIGRFELSVPGKHNALNALANIAIAVELGLDIKKTQEAIKSFSGTKRRFQVIGQKRNIVIVDDYAHHPTEIRATIDAANNFHDNRVIIIFQPHRYSRTKILGTQLGEAFQKADQVIITDIYAAGEKPIPGVSSENIYKAANNIGCNAMYIHSCNEIENYLLNNVKENDLVITMGAGDIWKVGQRLLEKL
ncbi:MAG: UDP-N-acetylmuramate--L-alanine ligase [Syntrophomonadaceae bacterium]|nr:UDP-N-acetylmuramate--L-alanine ligase [Syntrophomonadaceae bacterium]MDD4548198.1 UDP-N-acetylmuramate--L-alanine ligase [Syntrophomonadaceae bacterium]